MENQLSKSLPEKVKIWSSGFDELVFDVESRSVHFVRHSDNQENLESDPYKTRQEAIKAYQNNKIVWHGKEKL